MKNPSWKDTFRGQFCDLEMKIFNKVTSEQEVVPAYDAVEKFIEQLRVETINECIKSLPKKANIYAPTLKELKEPSSMNVVEGFNKCVEQAKTSLKELLPEEHILSKDCWCKPKVEDFKE